MTKIIISIIFLLCCLPSYAQQENEIQKKKTDNIIQNRFPRTRTFNLTYDRSLSREFESELADQDFTKGTINSQQAIDFSANIPLFNFKKWKISTSANYRNYQFEFDDVENISDDISDVQKQTSDFNYFAISLNSTFYGSLFKKPLIYNGSIIVDGSDKGIERLKGFVSASLPLKQTEYATITVGLLAIIDPTSQIPIAPIITYNQKFKNSNWEFDVILPQRVSFVKPVGNKSRLTIGSFFGSDGFYVNINEPYLPDTYSYNQLKIDGGIIYEYIVGKNLIATVQGGARKFISNRLTEKGTQNKDYIYKNNQEITGYFNVGISFNPFK